MSEPVRVIDLASAGTQVEREDTSVPLINEFGHAGQAHTLRNAHGT